MSIINITQNLSSEIDIELHNIEFYGCVCLRTSSDEVEIIDWLIKNIAKNLVSST